VSSLIVKSGAVENASGRRKGYVWVMMDTINCIPRGWLEKDKVTGLLCLVGLRLRKVRHVETRLGADASDIGKKGRGSKREAVSRTELQAQKFNRHRSEIRGC
jgi:hypothetical protein